MSFVLKDWDELPEELKTDAVRPYYDILKKKQGQLVLKRVFDAVGSLSLTLILSPLMGGIAIWIRLDSEGPVIFKQERLTQYGKRFNIFKFRTMVNNAQDIGSIAASEGDSRVTRVGEKIRAFRLDELPQLFNILSGDMSFVGPRPDLIERVRHYTDEMKAVYLVPAGVTSRASIAYKDEAKLLKDAEDVDAKYINEIMPAKMQINLKQIKAFSCLNDIKIMIDTVREVFG